MAYSANVSVMGFGALWSTGREILDIEVTLGQNKNSSTATITLADPGGAIGAGLINHTKRSGGFPEPEKDDEVVENQETTPTTGTKPKVQGDKALSVNVRAFLDVIAFAEGADYNVRFGGFKFRGYRDHPRIKYRSGSLVSDAAGRYQFLSTTWDEFRVKTGVKDFSPASQDRVAVALIKRRNALGYVEAGNFEKAIYATNREWASFPGSPFGQPTKTIEELREVWDRSRARYASETRTKTAESKKSKPTTEPVVPDTPPVKGNKLTINIEGIIFEYLHTGTIIRSDGTTTVEGQGARWVLSRQKRNTTNTNIKLSQLAQKVAKRHGLTLQWKSEIDPLYLYLDQTQMSDYELLRKEAEYAGLFVSEKNLVLTVKSLNAIRDTDLVVSPGINLIRYQVHDKAVTDEAEGESSSLRQNESKEDMDPATGQIETTNDTVDSKTKTGKTSDEPRGTQDPSAKSQTDNARGRAKRLKGMPSSFLMPMLPSTLILEPLDAIRTINLPEPLNRVWEVDRVVHNLRAGTTELAVFSPVEVIDVTPPTETKTPSTRTSEPAQESDKSSSPGHYIHPVRTGLYVVTDIRRRRTPTRMHHGTDVGTPVGVDIFAMNDGIVEVASTGISGYGTAIYLRHPDGFQTRYAHLSQLLVKVGQRVKRGQVIAKSGNTGVGTGAHLHYEIRNRRGQSLNPAAVGLPVTKRRILR